MLDALTPSRPPRRQFSTLVPLVSVSQSLSLYLSICSILKNHLGREVSFFLLRLSLLHKCQLTETEEEEMKQALDNEEESAVDAERMRKSKAARET